MAARLHEGLMTPSRSSLEAEPAIGKGNAWDDRVSGVPVWSLGACGFRCTVVLNLMNSVVLHLMFLN